MFYRIVLLACSLWAYCCAVATAQRTDSVYVHFRTGSAEIDSAFADNRTALNRIAAHLHDSASGDSATTITSIAIYGAASPEGSSAFNSHLSRRRAETVARWITAVGHCHDSLIHVNALGADWNTLRSKVMADPDVPHRPKVLEAIERVSQHSALSKAPPSAI